MQAHPTLSPPPIARPPLAARLLAGVLSLLFALGLGELIATCAQDGAYPTLNLYEADPVLGVRLTPGTSTRVTSPSGVATDYRTNALGFRGAEWPRDDAAGLVPGRVLIVGDSQVMGWGVPEEAAFGARIEGFEVLAAGAPTWGPLEYVRVLGELVPRLRPERVVLVLNAANDWLEAPVPNVRRTTALDGWARVPVGVADTVPAAEFPLRRFLLGRSHLVLALRLLFDPPPSRELAPSLATRFIADLPAYLAPDPPYRSRLARFVATARMTCERYDCELVPVLLPMDLQVHPAEWKKYRVPPRDARPTLALAAALQADVPDLVDLLPALAKASPGAFLPDDYHLSAAGHAAVAAALEWRLRRPYRPGPTTTSLEHAR